MLLWRLTVELHHGETFAESAEKLASRIGGALLFALAFYVVASAGWKLWTRTGGEFSATGLLLSVAAIPIMYVLSRRKLDLAGALGSRGAAQWVLGAWWVDPVASLAVVWLLVREGREAWAGEECCDHSH